MEFLIGFYSGAAFYYIGDRGLNREEDDPLWAIILCGVFWPLSLAYEWI